MPLFVTVTPGTTVTNSTTLDATTLNLLGTPSVDVIGTVDGGSLSLAAGSVGTTQLAANAVTFAKLQQIGADKLIGRDSAGTGDAAQIGVGGGLEFTGSDTVQIASRGVSEAKLFEVTTKKLLGRNATTNGDVQQITVGSGLALSDAGTLSASVKTWTSSELSVPAGGSKQTVLFTDTTLGGAPDILTGFLKCVDAGGDASYAQNDLVLLDSVISDTNEVETPAFGRYVDSTSINCITTTHSSILVPNKTNGQYTAATTAVNRSKWRLVLKAIKFS
jgi:hypothetical protein